MVARFAKKFFGRLSGWIGVNLVQDVPEDVAACEFDCSKEGCEGPDLVNCERRIRSEAAERRARDGKTAPTGQPDEVKTRHDPAGPPAAVSTIGEDDRRTPAAGQNLG